MRRKAFVRILCLLILASLECFHPNFLSINSQFCKFVTYLCAVLLICGTYKSENQREHKLFCYMVFGIFICQIISAFNAFLYEGQSITVSLLATMQGTAYILLIPLIKSKLSISDIEKIVIIFAFCFIAFSLVNRLTPTPLFGSADDFVERGAVRFRVIGVYWAMLALVMKANAYAIHAKRGTLLWVFFSLFAIVMTLTRQNILASFLMAGLLFFFKAKISKKIALVSLMVALFYFVLPQFKVYNSLLEKTEDDRNAQEQYDNIRIVAADFFLFECPRNTSQLLFGHGIPSFGNSIYGNRFEAFQSATGIVREDVGYCGFFYNHGLIATMIVILLFIGSLLYKIPDEYIYLKYFSGAFLLLNIASAPSLANYNIIPFILCIAMILKVSELKKLKDTKK